MTLMSNSTIKHHPKSQSLALFAAGQMGEARAVVLATHLTLCKECRTAVRDFETLGGAVLETVDPVPMSNTAMEDFWSRAGEEIKIAPPPATNAANDFDFGVALPLQRYLKGDLDSVIWKSSAPGLSQHIIKAQGYREGALRLLKIMPGTRIPKHTHDDGEFTLILRGAYEDELGEFGPGDFADLDDENTHTPYAIGDEPCICLVATNAPLRFKSLVAKAAQPFVWL